jgi:hypothetical protein
LPTSLAVAFFAALSVVVAHMLYQWFAPTIIRLYTLSEYESKRVRNFIEARSDNALYDAYTVLSRGVGYYHRSPLFDHVDRLWQTVKSDLRYKTTTRRAHTETSSRSSTQHYKEAPDASFIISHHIDALSLIELMFLDGLIRKDDEVQNKMMEGLDNDFNLCLLMIRQKMNSFGKVETESAEREAISRAAIHSYLTDGSQHPYLILLCYAVYLISIIQVLFLVYQQTSSIVVEAGWHPVSTIINFLEMIWTNIIFAYQWIVAHLVSLWSNRVI